MLIELIKLYREKSILLMVPLGFFCGLPFSLTASILAQRLSQTGIDLATVGLFSLISIPYSFKFIWSPLVDRMDLPILTKWLGRRRGWMLFSQVIITITLLLLGTLDPNSNTNIFILVCILLAFFTATQDIVALTYQVERLSNNQYGPGEAMGVVGYRLGMIVAGAGSLYLANWLQWGQVYQVMSLISIGGIIFTLLVIEPEFKHSEASETYESSARKYLLTHSNLNNWQAELLAWLHRAVVCPFVDFIQQKHWLLNLVIMFFYKAGDNLIYNMNNIFLIDLGFSKIEIANASKIFGMIASIIGGFIGGAIIRQWGILKGLFYGAILHALSLICYLILCNAGYKPSIFYMTIGMINLTGGIRLTALFSYQLMLCSPLYAATQLSLFSSIVQLGRTIFSAVSGYLVIKLGWRNFFSLAILLSIPGILLVYLLSYYQTEDLMKFRKKT